MATCDEDFLATASAAACSSAWPQLSAPMLPFWQEEEELPEHNSAVRWYHTDPCQGFRAGQCPTPRLPGKKGSSQCFEYHAESQRRRPLVDATTGQLRYWDAPCPTAGRGDPATVCPQGDDCPYAHSKEEVSYHAAKYKTRLCDTRHCRGQAVCCFAHSEAEIRWAAPERYSYWCLVSPNAQPAGLEWPTAAGGDWAGGEMPSLGPSMYHPSRYKYRFCASYPEVSRCRRGAACAFAHSREEVRRPLLTLEEEEQQPDALTEEFFMYKFKTLWCPIGVQHDWQTCAYAHNYQDARRKVSIGYGPRPCPYWNKKDTESEYSQRCPLGLRCPFSHGAKEQLYHPAYFRSIVCRDLRGGRCPRGILCAFYHMKKERRRPAAGGDVGYELPLPKGALPEDWVQDFLQPPFFPEAAESTDLPSGKAAPAARQAAAVPSFPAAAMCPPCVPRAETPLWGGRFAAGAAKAKAGRARTGSADTTSASSHDSGEGDTDEAYYMGGASYFMGAEASCWPGEWPGQSASSQLGGFGSPWWGVGGSQWWLPDGATGEEDDQED